MQSNKEKLASSGKLGTAQESVARLGLSAHSVPLVIPLRVS